MSSRGRSRPEKTLFLRWHGGEIFAVRRASGDELAEALVALLSALPGQTKDVIYYSRKEAVYVSSRTLGHAKPSRVMALVFKNRRHPIVSQPFFSDSSSFFV